MENNVTRTDLEYYKRYVNSGNEEIWFPLKIFNIILFIFLPAIVIGFSYKLDSVTLRITFLAIMAGGIVCTIASDKWFSGNRGRLFLVWLESAAYGIVLFSIGVVLAYGISNMLILIFIAIHIVIAVWTRKIIMKRISNRQFPKENGVNRIISWVYSPLGARAGIILVFFIISQVIADVDNDIIIMIIAASFMTASTVIWIRIRRLYQLYYAVKYNINVVNIRDNKKGWRGLSKDFKCPLFGRAIEESLCIKINYENEEIMKQDKINDVKEQLNMTSDEIKQVCKSCKRYPFRETPEGGSYSL